MESSKYRDPTKTKTSLEQVFLQELNSGVELEVLIGFFLEAVAFVFSQDVPDGPTLLFQGGDDLVAFADGDTRIVFAGYHHHGFLNFRDVIHGRDFFQEFTHLGIAFIAILHSAEVAAVGFGVFEESDEVGHTNDIDRAADAVAIEGGDGESHVAAIAATSDGDAGGVKVGLSGDPVEECVDVLVGVFAFEAVVQECERLAVPRGTSDVGVDQGDAKFIEKVVVAAEESRSGLAFGSAVDENEDRPLASEFGWRPVEEAGDHFAVETLPFYKLSGGKRAGGDRGFALGPAGDLAIVRVERECVGSDLRIRKGKTELPAVTVPPQARDNPFRNSRFGNSALGRVEDMNGSKAVFIGEESDVPAVFREVELFDVPGDGSREKSVLFGGQVDIGKTVEFGVFVGGDVKAFAVFRKLTIAVMDRTRNEGSFFTRLGVD